MIRPYTVSIETECECPRCGWPVDVGERAYEWESAKAGSAQSGYCSREHARLSMEEAEARHD